MDKNFDDMSDEEFDRAQDAERFEQLQKTRRNNGYLLLCAAGVFCYTSYKVASKADSTAEVIGALSVPIIVLAVALYYLLTKPKMK